MEFYLRSLLSCPDQEVSMKRSNLQDQPDLFSDVSAPPALRTLQIHYDELVNLISKLLQEVILDTTSQASKEDAHEQDHR
jgi:hypothetical protein